MLYMIGPVRWSRRMPALLAIGLTLLGVVAVAARLDAPSDSTMLVTGGSTWRADGVVVTVSGATPGNGLRSGDLVTHIGGHRLADGFGGVAPPQLGERLAYQVVRDGQALTLVVPVERPDPYRPIREGWGDLVFVVALAGLALALYVRRREEQATTPLLLLAAGLLGSTITMVAGLPVLDLAVGGPRLWLFHLGVIVVYSVAWGGLLAFSLVVTADHPWLAVRPWLVRAAYGAPLAVMAGWAVAAGRITTNPLLWLGLVHAGQTAVVAATLLLGMVVGGVAYRRTSDSLMRGRLRWLFGGGVLASLLGLLGWHLPELLTGRQLLPWGALGLSALPFVAGIAVALRRHQLFEIERLANRSLVYAAVVAVLVTGYVALVALLVAGLRISGTVAAALAAAGAALALAPVRNAAQAGVNRLMYGDRDDPAGVLARLSARLQAVMLPDEVLPAVVEMVAQSLRLPYLAIDVADGADCAGGFRPAAEQGVAAGAVHCEPLLHHGLTVGRLRASARGRDDLLDPADLALIASLAQQLGPAVQAVRLHADLVRSRAEVVALREDERRRLRRDLHDGLGPALAAIGLKAGLAAREVLADAPARVLLGEITSEVKSCLADVRRLVEALRPPALDELGLIGAVRSRAAALAGRLMIEVSGTSGPKPLPAAVETAAFRIAVEALTNAVRHSGGHRCTVHIVGEDSAVEITVRDDGRGPDHPGTAGVGLPSMRERAAEVGGVCTVRSPAEGGTLVHAWLPLGLGGRDDPADPGR